MVSDPSCDVRRVENTEKQVACMSLIGSSMVLLSAPRSTQHVFLPRSLPL